LNLDFSLGTYVLGLMKIYDLSVINKVALIWSVVSRKEKSGGAGDKA
jgi:hypothetical protein